MDTTAYPPRPAYQQLESYRAGIVMLFLIAAAWYLTWRLGSFNPEAKLFSWLLYAAEAYGFVTTLLHLFMTWRLTIRTPEAPESGLSVDIFIPTYNEPVELVRRTLLAAIHMEYPHQTWLLDDGNRPEMAQLAGELGARYLARTDNTDAKAGNLNNALHHSQAEFIAIFDADHAPQRNFLAHTLGYFKDQQVAFVQTPQDFFNLDSYQHRWDRQRKQVWTEQSLFFRVIQRGKDYWNAAFFCGSCAVIRRSSLDHIGGFATGTVTEDLHTSIRIHKQGYKSVYHAEALAFGIAPSNVTPFLRQRIRWGQGAMQVWRREGVLFTKGLTLAQRLNYFASMATYFDGWQKGLFYLAPAIVLLTGVMPIKALGSDFLLHFIPYYFLTFWAFEEVGRGYGQTIIIEQYNMGRFAAFAWATLGLFSKHLKFHVTSKRLSQRSKAMEYLSPQIVVMLLNGLAIPVGAVLFFSVGYLPLSAVVANSIWAGVNLALAASILLFTARHLAYRRQEYRFPIPLPAKITWGERVTLYATVDNISSSGCSLYGAFPEIAGVGDHIHGEIHLPSGPLPFRAKVAAVLATDTHGHVASKSLGCHFTWENAQHADMLDLFLYGSDLQWQLLRLNEQALTPLDKLRQHLGLAKAPKDFAPEHWNVMVYEINGQGVSRMGLICTPATADAQQSVITFAPIEEGMRLRIRAFTRRGQPFFQASTTQCQHLESQVAPIYLCKLAAPRVSCASETAPAQPETAVCNSDLKHTA